MITVALRPARLPSGIAEAGSSRPPPCHLPSAANIARAARSSRPAFPSRVPSAAAIASDAVVTTTSFIPVTADDGSQAGDPRRITNGDDLS